MNYRFFLLVAAAASLSWFAPVHALSLNSDCHALKLVSASGVPGSGVHKYTFSGTCNIITNRASGPFVEKTVPAEASATWDAAKKELSESFRVLAEFSGVAKADKGNTTTNLPWQVKPLAVTSRFACNDDPLISNAACGLLAHENPSYFNPFSNPAKQQSRPLLKGKTSLAEASKLSAANKPLSVVTGTLPPAEGTPARLTRGIASPAAAVAFEVEDLFQQGKVQVNGGALAVQPMQGFGNGWGNNAQLFWSGISPGAVLDLTIKVPVSGKYRVELYMTRAPDYGDLLLQVEGHTASASFNGFAAAVAPSDAVDVGSFQLPAGERRISLKLIGKNTKSSGYLVGVDQVRLFPMTQ